MTLRVPPPPPVLSTDLRAVVDAFGSRSKSLKRELTAWTYSVSVDERERLDVDMKHFSRHDVRLSFWSDGLLWVRVCRLNDGKKGWASNLAFHGTWDAGRLLSIVTCLERTFAYVATASDVDEGQVAAIWKAAKPKWSGSVAGSS